MLRIIFLVLFFGPALLWLKHTGDLSLYFSEQMPPGQIPYIFSKLAGMYALLIMFWQVSITMLERLSNALGRKAEICWLGLPHRMTGTIVFGLVVAHFLLFFSGVSLRQGYPAFGLFLPNLKDYYHIHVSFGLFAFWGLCIVVATGIVSGIKGTPLSKWHNFFYVSLGLTCLHAFSIGSEVASQMGIMFFGVLATAVSLLICLRFGVGRVKRGVA
ncbi:MAG: hypothetical protein ACRBB6_07650 [Neptuniibacter sp.]